ncbi:AMP-binding protein [Asanoa sp. NPDC049518]|uniref:AMP-binding protein n=1 Tax=unclassified Asanoa TaxID=2685164 RepID=UPI00343DBD17
MGAEDAAVAARVRAAWADVLGDDAGTDDEQAFVSAGGHSLAAARLIARLRTDLAVELPMSAILRDDPTLADLVAAVTSRLDGQVEPAPAAEQGPADVTDRPAEAPLGPTLRRIWTWHRLQPDSPAYNVVRVLSIAGRLQPATLRASLADLAARHEALRCAVVEPRPGQPSIVVGDAVTVPLAVEVVRTADGDPAEAVDEALYRFANRPFPMASPPLWRVGLVYAPALDRTFLVLVMHHLISDLRTTDLVLTELAEAYAARAAGEQPAVAPAAPSLLAHLAHEAGLVGTPRWQDDLAWWEGRLAGVSSAAPLPLSAAERDESVHLATTRTLGLTAEESADLDAALRSRGLTPALFFLTAASAALAAWSGQERTEVVGLPSVRLSRPEDERLVGFLLDTLPLPVVPDRRHAFLRTYDALRDAYSDATDHALPAFDDIVDRLRLPRTTRSPLIRLWFSDLTQEVTPPSFGDAAVVEHDLPPAWALFDLGLYLVRRGGAGYRLHLVSPQGLVDPADATALLAQIVRLVTRAAADPARPLGELLEVPADASRAAAEPAVPTVELVRRHPGAAAIADEHGVISYADLSERVAEAAAELAPSAVVAVPARREREFVVRLLACWRAGATAVLLDADWPEQRRRRAFDIAGVTHAYPWSGVGPATPVEGLPAPSAGPAHVLFTSGTTGDPLAVRVATPVAEEALADLANLLGVTAADRVSMLSGPAHDPVLRDIGLALRAGATLCVPPPDAFGNPGRLAAWLRRERITVVDATPALLSLVLGADPDPLPDLRAVVCGGSPLSVATAELIRSRAVNAVVVNGYGCTETPQIVVANRIGPAESLPPTAQVPIGRPLPRRRVELRAPDGRRCDTGQLGELWVAEPHIAERYLEGPRPRVERFLTDDHGVRWLRTGDLARADAAGRLHLAGRTDRQVLVYGYRVMLEELEAVARGCAGVADAVAQVVDDGSRQAIRVWAQRSAGAEVGEDAVRAHLAGVLPANVVPARVIVVDRLEIGDTLKPIAPEREPGAAERAAPPDARVRELAESVLGRGLDPAANFFDAGFTSISLLQMSAELTELLGRPVEALSLFHHPNLRALSSYLFGEPVDRPAPAPSTTDRSDRLARMGASRRQVRSWIQESANGPSEAH